MKPDELNDDTPLFSSGIIDSMDLLGMIILIEKEFSMKVTPGELSLDNFDSIGKILKFIERSKPS